jgi:carbonic anhydrase
MRLLSLFMMVFCLSILLSLCGQNNPGGSKAQQDTLATNATAIKSASTEEPKIQEAPAEDPSKLSGEEVLAKLKKGNEGFVENLAHNNASHGNTYSYSQQIEHTGPDQHPVAFVLTCMDSRVPPEIIFDQGIGELFVDRVGGNVEDQFILGSMEYAVAVKGVKLIVVLGHRYCGAIHSAFEHVDPSNEDLVPLVAFVKKGIVPNDQPPYDASAKHNVKKTIEDILKNSKTIRNKVASHELVLVGALYDVTNGKVDWNTAEW